MFSVQNVWVHTALQRYSSCLLIAVFLASGGSGCVYAQSTLLEQPALCCVFYGCYTPTKSVKAKYVYDAALVANIPDVSGGGAASFGWMEQTNEVVLLGYVKRTPSIQMTRTHRDLKTNVALTAPEMLPRYVMMCSWEKEEDKLGRRFSAYLERDDSKWFHGQRTSQHQIDVHVEWVVVKSKRAQDSFAGRDYCDEIAKTGRAPTPVWMPDDSITSRLVP